MDEAADGERILSLLSSSIFKSLSTVSQASSKHSGYGYDVTE